MFGIGALIGAGISSLDAFKSDLVGLYSQSREHEYNSREAALQEMYQLINMAVQHGYSKEDMESQFGYDSALQAQSACQSRALAERQNELSKELNDYNAARDYANQVRYIGDAVASYRSALAANGYNPILALQSSIPSLSSGSHSAVAGMPSVSSPSISSQTSPVGSPGSSGGVGHVHGSASGIAQSAAEFARLSSEVTRNEAAAMKDKANAAESLEKAKSEVLHREPKKSEIDSTTVKNYGQTAAHIATGIGTAYGAQKVSHAVKSAVSAVRSGAPAAVAAKPVADVLAPHMTGKAANSGLTGSRIVQTLAPAAAIAVPAAAIATGLGSLGATMKYAKEHPKSNTAKIFNIPGMGNRLR